MLNEKEGSNMFIFTKLRYELKIWPVLYVLLCVLGSEVSWE